MLPPVVAWIDPGKMTGIAKYERGAFIAVELPFYAACSQINALCSYHGPALWIGWERYRVDLRRPQHNANDAIEPIGVARFAAMGFGCVILPEAQQHTPDATERRRLQAIGWWVPGKNDAQSAACHMLAWMKRNNQVPPREREILQGLTERVS